ncbi:MAG: NAD(P)H-dependent oxidoreductase [Candidatus Pacebacteria bacterium]|nr:NAD(P)H-dependent oxidoreductase [Candidatus Paceibacterota bacterium]
MAPLNIKVIIGSTREGRFGDKAAAWVTEHLAKQEGIVAETLDLRDYDMPLFNEPVSPAFKSAPFAHEAVARFTKKIAEADGYIIVTPEYNHSTSGALKNAMDWVYQEWNDKPVAFVAYGSVGGARAVEHLRLIAIELQMAPIREAVHLLGNDYFATVFGKSTPAELFAKYDEKADVMIQQLTKWTRGLKGMRG